MQPNAIDISDTLDSTVRAIAAFQINVPNEDLERITTTHIPEESIPNAKALDLLFFTKQANIVEKIFQEIILLHDALQSNHLILLQLRDVFAKEAKKHLIATQAIKVSNDFISVCKEQIDTIRRDDEDLLVEHKMRRSLSNIQMEYGAWYESLAHTEKSSQPFDFEENLNILTGYVSSAIRSTTHLMMSNIAFSQLKIAYYNIADQSGTIPLSPMTVSQIAHLTPEDYRKALCNYALHDLKSARATESNLETFMHGLKKFMSVCFSKNTPFGKPKP